MMTHTHLLREICRGVFVCLTTISLAFAVKAQERILWQGAVNKELINVYANPSTSERVVRTLRKDDVVDVVLEINNTMGDEWCRIALSGQSEPLGYVLCFNLVKGHFPPRQTAQSGRTATESPLKSPKQFDVTVANSPLLTNKDILDMHKMGLSPDVIVAKIKSSLCNFVTSPSQLQKLKTGGLPDAVILAMVEAPVATTTSAVAQGSNSTQPQAMVDCSDASEDECERRIVQLSQTNCSGVSTAECRNRIAQIMQASMRPRVPNVRVSVAGNDYETIVFDSAQLFGERQGFETEVGLKRLFCTFGFSKITFRPSPTEYGEGFDLNCSGTTDAKPSADSASFGGTNSPRQQPSSGVSHAKPAGGLSKNAAKICAKHPDWTEQMCDLVANHRIAVGMNQEQVHESLETGTVNRLLLKKHKVYIYQSGSDRVEVWDCSVDPAFIQGKQISNGYTQYIYFVNGLVTSWAGDAWK